MSTFGGGLKIVSSVSGNVSLSSSECAYITVGLNNGATSESFSAGGSTFFLSTAQPTVTVWLGPSQSLVCGTNVSAVGIIFQNS